MMQQMYGLIKKDKTRNEDIQDKVGVASVEEKMQESRLRRFKHVKRRCMNALVLRR